VSADIKRNLRVRFSATGAKKVQAEVTKLDGGMTKTGKAGNKAFKTMEGSAVKASKAMESTLQPLDDSFKGVDRLNSIVGKFGMVGALLGGTVSLVTAALSAFSDETERAAAAAEAQKKQFAELESLANKYAGTLRTVLLIEAVRANEKLQEALAGTVRNTQRVIQAQDKAADAQRELMQLGQKSAQLRVRRAQVIAAAEARGLRITEATTRGLDIQLKTIAHQVKATKKSIDDAGLSYSYAAMMANSYATDVNHLKNLIDQLDASTKTTTKSNTKATKSIDVRAAATRKAADAKKQWMAEVERALSIGASRMSAAELEERLTAARATGLKEAAKLQREYTDTLQETLATQLKVSDATRAATTASVTGLEEMAAAAEAWGAGATVIQAAQLLATGIKAGVDGADYAAESIAAFATGNAAAGIGLAAASLAKFAVAANAAKGLTELGASSGGVSTGGGSGGGSAGGGSEGLTGDGPERGGGPVQVNVNFTGAAAGLGRFLVSEINNEAQTRGGRRLVAGASRARR